MPLRAAVISSAISWPMPRAGAREAVVFSDSQVLNLLLWASSWPCSLLATLPAAFVE